MLVLFKTIKWGHPGALAFAGYAVFLALFVYEGLNGIAEGGAAGNGIDLWHGAICCSRWDG